MQPNIDQFNQVFWQKIIRNVLYLSEFPISCNIANMIHYIVWSLFKIWLCLFWYSTITFLFIVKHNEHLKRKLKCFPLSLYNAFSYIKENPSFFPSFLKSIQVWSPFEVRPKAVIQKKNMRLVNGTKWNEIETLRKRHVTN